MFTGVVRGLLGLAMLAAAAPAAHACTVARPLDITDIGKAELVVRGRVVAYEPPDASGARQSADYARIRIEVAETWRGEERGEWELFWRTETSGLPGDWPFGDDTVIAAIAIPERHLGRIFDGPGRPERAPRQMLILQSPCAPPFIFRTTPPEDEVRRYREEMEGVRDLMKQMPSKSMRRRMERMLGDDPEKTYRRRIAALRACVEEDMEICKAVWRNP